MKLKETFDLLVKSFEAKKLFEATKEPLRLLVLALIAYAITWVGGLPQEGYIPVITLVLRLIDSYLHEVGKTSGGWLLKGLTRF